MEHALNHNPLVATRHAGRDYHTDILSRLLRDRIVFVSGPITDDLANLVVAQMLHLESESSTQPINLYINSPGGSVVAGLAILDVMRLVAPPVATHVLGQAASMAAVLLACGTKSYRAALPNARIMIHQPMISNLSGQASDIEIHANELLETRSRLNQILATACGRDVTQIERDTNRDRFMTSPQALEYGLVDRILETRRPEAKITKRKARHG